MKIKKLKNNIISIKGSLKDLREMTVSDLHFFMYDTESLWIADTSTNAIYFVGDGFDPWPEKIINCNFFKELSKGNTIKIEPMNKLDDEDIESMLENEVQIGAYPVGKTITINTDGACVGNPGMRGIGGVLYCEGIMIDMFSDRIGNGTVNTAEYEAVKKALVLAMNYRPSKVLVKSDSQLIVNQINGAYNINSQQLQECCDAIHQLVREMKCKVSFEWFPREENGEADALASNACGTPSCIIKNDAIIEWEPDKEYSSKILANVGLVSELDKKIYEFNTSNPKFGDFMKLKATKDDPYSLMADVELQEAISGRFGANTLSHVQEVLKGSTTAYSENAMCWIARGLNPDKSFKKSAVDMETKVNCQNR